MRTLNPPKVMKKKVGRENRLKDGSQVMMTPHHHHHILTIASMTMHSKPSGVYLVNGKYYVSHQYSFISDVLNSVIFLCLHSWCVLYGKKGVPPKQTTLNLGKKYFHLAQQ